MLDVTDTFRTVKAVYLLVSFSAQHDFKATLIFYNVVQLFMLVMKPIIKLKKSDVNVIASH